MNEEAKVPCNGCGILEKKFFMNEYSNGKRYCGSC